MSEAGRTRRRLAPGAAAPGRTGRPRPLCWSEARGAPSARPAPGPARARPSRRCGPFHRNSVDSKAHHWLVKHSPRVLHGKALSSMRTAMAAFNSPHDDGRTTSVLLHLQHSFEMLLKAGLSQGGKPVFDKRTGRSISFEQSVRQCQQLGGLKLKDEEAGTLRAVDAMRDDEQHWFTKVGEGPPVRLPGILDTPPAGLTSRPSNQRPRSPPCPPS